MPLPLHVAGHPQELRRVDHAFSMQLLELLELRAGRHAKVVAPAELWPSGATKDRRWAKLNLEEQHHDEAGHSCCCSHGAAAPLHAQLICKQAAAAPAATRPLAAGAAALGPRRAGSAEDTSKVRFRFTMKIMQYARRDL